MKILIVEDDLNKMRQLAELIRESFPKVTILQKRAYQSGLKSAIEDSPDLIVLDMSMPTYDICAADKGGRTRPYAGREILRQLARKASKCAAIVVTAFETFGEREELMTLDQLTILLEQEFGKNYLGTISYSAAESRWRDELRIHIAEILRRIESSQC